MPGFRTGTLEEIDAILRGGTNRIIGENLRANYFQRGPPSVFHVRPLGLGLNSAANPDLQFDPSNRPNSSTFLTVAETRPLGFSELVR